MSENLTTSPEVALAQSTDASAGTALLTVEGRQPTDEEVLEAYEVQRVVRFAQDNKCTRLALQFPDWMLVHCPIVARLVSERLPEGSIAFVLGDTSYGADCVDEVAAKHLGADGVAHFGPAFSHATSSLPTLFVFGKGRLDLATSADAIGAAVPKQTLEGDIAADATSARPGRVLAILADSQYNSSLSELADRLTKHPAVAGDSRVEWTVLAGEQASEQVLEKHVTSAASTAATPGMPVVPTVAAGEAPEAASGAGTSSEAAAGGGGGPGALEGKPTALQLSLAGAHLQLPSWCTDLSMVHLAYVGDPGPGGWAAATAGSGSTRLTQAMMRLGCSDAIVYSPRKQKLARGPDIHRQLSRRFMSVEQAKVAKTVGIVVGTLAARRFRDVVWGLKRLVRAAGRGCYTFVVGKLKPEKLANFGEIDVFVLVGAGDSALVDTREFPKPVVLPYEAVMAFNPRVEWDGKIIMDFGELLQYLPPKPVSEGGGEAGGESAGGGGGKASGASGASGGDAGSGAAGAADPGADSPGSAAAAGGGTSSVAEEEGEEEGEGGDEPFFSLVTGKYESRGHTKSEVTGWGGSSALTVSGAGQVALSSDYTGAGRLQQLSWRGMEYSVGDEADTKVHRGWHGVASGFEGEGEGDRGVEGGASGAVPGSGDADGSAAAGEETGSQEEDAS